MYSLPAKSPFVILLAIIALSFRQCTAPTAPEESVPDKKIPVIFDTDANNELDDQHALAYLLLNDGTFDIKGITVNATTSGGEIQGHYDEAKRILQLCNEWGEIPLYKGANAGFDSIRTTIAQPHFDGAEGVDFIINTIKAAETQLVVLAVGKLTNIALALEKAPEIASKVRLVWLGSNYPEPGEYNQVNDTASLSYLLASEVPFEMVTVRYGKPSGTDAVKVTQAEINARMPGKGPRAAQPITGRHGGTFSNFGDYSVNLFEHIDYHGNPPSRALFDMAAVAVVKNPDWAQQRSIPAPRLVDGRWIDQPDNDRKIVVWENFDRQKIMEDFYRSFE